MNPNRLLQQNGLLKQQNKSLNMVVQNMHNELQANKILLTQSVERARLEERKLSESSLVEKELAEHKKQLSSATERARLAERKLSESSLVEKELAEHKKQLSSATERARLVEKKLSEYSLVEKLREVKYSPPLHITRTRRHLAKIDDTLYEDKLTERMDDTLHDEPKMLQVTDMEVTLDAII